MSARTVQPRASESLFSQKLRLIGELIGQRKYDEALAIIEDAILNDPLTDLEKSRLSALAGDCDFQQGNYEDADSFSYATAAGLAATHPRLWLRPVIGRVRALLKVPDVNAAVAVASNAWSAVQSKITIFDEQVRQAKENLTLYGTLSVPMLPQRASVVATRLGYLFFQEGEPETAKAFFEAAISVNRHGACRARQGMAKVALAQGNPREAVAWATESIRMGKFQAKTLSAWPILVAACRKRGGWRIRQRLIAGLSDAPPRVRARAILSIVSDLRKNDMDQWQEIADAWMTAEGENYPRVAKEIQKMRLSTAKAKIANTAEIRAMAETLLGMRVLGPREWLAGAKEVVRTSLLDNLTVDFSQLIGTGTAKYGPGFAFTARHSLALACIRAQDYVQARTLLEANLPANDPDHLPGSPMWAKSVWALARLESKLENHAAAASRYAEYFSFLHVPKRFCLQARLEWVKELIASGQTADILNAQAQMTAILNDVGVPDIRMNFARQLQFGPPELKAWGQSIFNQAAADAVTAFHAANHPAVALDILFKLTRRQVLDFGRSADAVAMWESFDADTQDWLWSGSATFWEYLGLVFEAYARSGDFAGAEQFANGILNDSAAPAEGLPYVGVPLARQWMRRGRQTEGLELFNRLANGAPRHPLCAWAWYWLALEAKRRGDDVRARKYACYIREAQRLKAGLRDEWKLDARALILMADVAPGHGARSPDVIAVPPPDIDLPSAHCTAAQLIEIAQHMNSDLNVVLP